MHQASQKKLILSILKCRSGTSLIATYCRYSLFHLIQLTATIYNYVKDGGPKDVDLFSVFTMSLCTLELKQALRSLLFQVTQL